MLQDETAASDDAIRLAAAPSLSKEERCRLYAAVDARFTPPTAVLRSILDEWLPGITSDNTTRFLMHQNMQAANEMVSHIHKKSKAQQQKLLESFKN